MSEAKYRSYSSDNVGGICNEAKINDSGSNAEIGIFMKILNLKKNVIY